MEENMVNTIHVPIASFVLLIVGALLTGFVIYDLIVTLFLRDKHSERWTARRNFPVRMIIYGALAFLGAGIWIFIKDWVSGVILIAGAIVTIGGVIWYSATHK